MIGTVDSEARAILTIANCSRQHRLHIAMAWRCLRGSDVNLTFAAIQGCLLAPGWHHPRVLQVRVHRLRTEVAACRSLSPFFMSCSIGTYLAGRDQVNRATSTQQVGRRRSYFCRDDARPHASSCPRNTATDRTRSSAMDGACPSLPATRQEQKIS